MLTRREFAYGAACLSTIKLGGLPAFAQGAVPMRRSVGAMPADDPDLEAYRAAVTAMKALPDTDPRNWERQMRIHLRFCPHGNWYFLPWHRAYLTAFERICRDLSGKADFALPYWDWSVDRQLPAAFGEGDPTSNVLNHPRPRFGEQDSLPNEFFNAEIIGQVLDSPDFETFGSRRVFGQSSAGSEWLRRQGEGTTLEVTIHNTVHIRLGGDMALGRSPLDPIFWLHHCNVDRLWAQWNEVNANSSEAMWLEMDISDQFVNPDGSAWSLTVADVADRATDALGYRYDTQPDVVAAAQPDVRVTELAMARSTLQTRAGSGGPRTLQLPSGSVARVASASNAKSADKATPLSVPVTIGESVEKLVSRSSVAPSGTTRSLTRGRSGAAAKERRIMAQILNVDAPKDNSTFVRVFVNCEYLTPETPISDPHYVTSFSFFAPDHGEHHGDHGKPSFSVDITKALVKAARSGNLRGDQVVVQLVAVGDADTPATELKPEAIEVAIL